MSERIDKLMQAAGLKENVLNSLERGDSMFVLTDQTLLFQDSGGTRRVTLRDLKRIHSDQDGLLRVETPAGTALTANLLGFDPAAVQAFFAQVRDATACAKQQATPTAVPPSVTPESRAAETKVTSANNASSAPATGTPVTGTPATGTPAAGSFTPAARPPASTAEPRQAQPPGATWSNVTPPVGPPPPSPAAPPRGAERPASPASPPAVSTPPARTVVIPQVSPVTPQGSPPSPSTVPVAPPPPAFKPQATVKPVVKAVRTPSVITDPEVLSRSEGVASSAPAVVARPSEDAAPAPRVGGSAAGSLASLAAVAGGVSAWTGALKAMSLVMLLATFGMAYFLYGQGQGLTGFWTLIAGGMGAVALWALSDVVRLLVSLAQAVSAEGGVMDVD